MATPFTKPYFGNNDNTPVTNDRPYNGWGNGWGMFNPFQQPRNQPNYNSTTNGGLQGLTPEVLRQIRDDFQNGDLNTRASLWRNQALRQFLEPLIGGDKDALNQIEMASWTANPTDITKYGVDQMRFTQMMKARQNGGGGTPSGSTTPNGGGGYTPNYIPVPAAGANPYGDYTALYRDQGGMIHDFGDNPTPTVPTTPTTGGMWGMPPWMGMNQRNRRNQQGGTPTGNSTPNFVNVTRTPTNDPGGVAGAYPGGSPAAPPPAAPPPNNTTQPIEPATRFPVATPANTTDLGRDPNDPYIAKQFRSKW